MKPRIYIETTVVSYFTAWPSRDVVIAGHQQITREWWINRLPHFEAAISELVLDEAGRGDPEAAKARLNAIAELPILNVSDDVAVIAKRLTEEGQIPSEFINDALHVAITAVNGIDYLVTWNCKHLANAFIRTRIENVIESFGYECPVICTPEELMEDMQ